MARHWLQIDLDLPEKPETQRICDLVDMDPPEVCGWLLMLWRWVDRHSESEFIPHVTPKSLSRAIGASVALWEAVAAVGWLEFTSDGVRIPGWDKRFSKGAKSRMQSAQRMAASRCSQDVAPERNRSATDVAPERNKSATEAQRERHLDIDIELDRELELEKDVDGEEDPTLGFASANPCPPDGEPLEPAPKPQPAKPSKPAADRSDEIRAVFAHYRTYHPKAFREPKSDSDEWKKIRARLREGYTVADLCEAIDGCHRSPWHCGQNPDGKRYQSLGLIVRNASKVSEFMEVPRRGTGPPVLTEKNQRNLRAVDEWLARTQHDDTERETGLCLGFDGTGSGVPNGGRSGDP